MGKDKTGQRVKGNQKPSSSGRSAELLGETKGFIGFGNLSDICYVPAASQGSAEDDSQISSEFRVALRKMSKKDCTTKMKALQEFETLCGSESLDSIKTTLPFWPRLYGKLSLDNERRVREAVQSAHSLLVSKVGKFLAPQLRLIMPAWVYAMTDPHPPTSLAAKKAFLTVFSEEKRSGVMIFCFKEIIEYITDNIIVQSAQTLSDPKTSTEEQRESKYHRILHSSFKGLELFLVSFNKTNEKKDEIDQKIFTLLDFEKFWKYSKHKEPLVRSAWFSCIKSLLEYDVEVTKKYQEQISRTIFSSLDESESSVLPHIWIAFLHLLVKLPEYWENYDKHQSVFNRIFSVLRDGGRGSAVELHPQLLPILSFISNRDFPEKKQFIIDFFRSISKSLQKDQILINKRDSKAIIIALFECLKYMSTQDPYDVTLWDVLLKYQVIELLKASLTDNPLLCNTNLYQEVSKLLYFWNYKSKVESKETEVNFLLVFWNLFLPECEEWLKEEDKEKLNKLECFFYSLKDPFHHFTNNNIRGVRFATSNPTPVSPVIITTKSLDPAVDEMTMAKHMNSVSVFIADFIHHCFESFKESNNICVYKLFSCLLSSFSTDDILLRLLNSDDKGDRDSDGIKCSFLEEFLFTFMETDQLPTEASINIFMHLYSQLTVDGKKNVLLNLKPSLSIGSVKLLTERMSERRKTDESASFWLRSPQLGCRLIKATQQLCAISVTQDFETFNSLKMYQDSFSLVTYALNNNYKEDIVFSIEYLSQIMKALQAAFNQVIPLPITNEKSLSFLENGLSYSLITLLDSFLDNSTCWKINGVGEILCSLFKIICYADCQAVNYDKLKDLIVKSFESYVKHSMRNTEQEDLFKKGYFNLILNELKRLFMTESTTYQMLYPMIELTEKLFIITTKYSPKEDCELILDHSLIQAGMNGLIPTELEWNELEQTLSPLYICHPLLFGWFYLREFPLSRSISDIAPWYQSYIRTCLFLLELLNALTANILPPMEESKGVDEKEVISLGQFTRLAALCLHATSHSTVVQQLNRQLNNDLISEDIEFGVSRIGDAMQRLLDKINVGNKKHIVKIIRDRCMDGSSFWCTTLRYILMKWIKLSSEAFTVVIELDDDALGVIATKQTLLGYMNEQNRLSILEEETAKLSSLSDDPFSAQSSIVLITSALHKLPFKVSKNTLHIVFQCLMEWLNVADNLFLFATDLSNVSWEEVSTLVNFIHLISVSVKLHSQHLDRKMWDFILCSLSSWIQSFHEAVKAIQKDSVLAMFICSATRCVYHVSKYIKNPSNEERTEEISSMQEEWEEFFSPPINDILFKSFLLCNESYTKNPNTIQYEVCQSIATVLHLLTSKELGNIKLSPLFNPEDEDNDLKLPDNLQTFMNHVSPLLLSRHWPSQYVGFTFINTMLPELMTAWDKNELPINEEDNLPQRSLPYSVIRTLKECEAVVEVLLKVKEFGDTYKIVPHTDAFTYTMGYLMSWMLTLKALRHASDANQTLYSTFIRESGMLNKLLNLLFRILPKSPIFSSTPKKGSNMFLSKLSLTPDYIPSNETVCWISCQVYMSCLNQLPATVRSWWTNKDRMTQQIVDNFTSSYVSPILINNELVFINESDTKFDNMTVKARLGAREVIATYTIDDTSMELVLRLAPNHPLSIVTLEDHKRVGVSLAEWRNWLFGLNTLLSHRNTSLLNSLAFWKKNIDQKFKGLEECCICYYVLHSTNNQIPKLLCKTCKKKFHPSCLYTWFNTSNKNTCPICRSLF